jgi:integrase
MEAVKLGDFVFPGQRPGRPLSGMAFEMLLRRMGSSYTAHGFRSSFRDWAGNETHFPRELAEHALAHVIGDKTEQAYRRSDALARRRELMEAWARHCTGESVEIVPTIGMTCFVFNGRSRAPCSGVRITGSFCG